MRVDKRPEKTRNFDGLAYGEPSMSSQRSKLNGSANRSGLGSNTLQGRLKGAEGSRSKKPLRSTRLSGTPGSQFGVKSSSIRPSKRRKVEEQSDLEEDSRVSTGRSSPMDDISSLVLGESQEGRRIRQSDKDSALESSAARSSSPDPLDANIPRPENTHPNLFHTLTASSARSTSGQHSRNSSIASASAGPSRRAATTVKAPTPWSVTTPESDNEDHSTSSPSRNDPFSKPRPPRPKILDNLPGASVDSAIAIDETPPDPPDPYKGIDAIEMEPQLDLKETKAVSLGRSAKGTGQLEFRVVSSTLHPNALDRTARALGSRNSPTAPSGRVAALKSQFENSGPDRPTSIPPGNPFATPIPQPVRPSFKSRMATRDGPSAPPTGPIRPLITAKPKKFDQSNGAPSGFVSVSSPNTDLRLQSVIVGGKDLIKSGEAFNLKLWGNRLSVEHPDGVPKSGIPPVFVVLFDKITQIQSLDMKTLKAKLAEPLIILTVQSGGSAAGKAKGGSEMHAIFVLDRLSPTFGTVYPQMMEKLGKVVQTKPQLIGQAAARAILEQAGSMTFGDNSVPLQHVNVDGDGWTPDIGQASFYWDAKSMSFGVVDNEDREAGRDRNHLFVERTKAVELVSIFGLNGAGADQKKEEAIIKLRLAKMSTRPHGSIVTLIFDRTSPLFNSAILVNFRNHFVNRDCTSTMSDQEAKEIITQSKLKPALHRSTIPEIFQRSAKPKLRRKVFVPTGPENEERTELDFEEPEFQTMGDENEVTSLRRSHRQKEAPFTAIPPVDETELLFKYPPIRFTQAEATRLQDEEFLNDTLVELGLKLWLDQLGRTNPEVAEQIWVFNSFFYKKLSNPKEGYESVKKWTAKVDIFSKKYIIVPINENLHWYLAVIYEPWHCLEPVMPTEDLQVTHNTRTPQSRRITRHRKSLSPIHGDEAIHVSDSDAADQDEVKESLLALPCEAPTLSSGPPSPIMASPQTKDFQVERESKEGEAQANLSRATSVELNTTPTEGLTASASRIWSKADPNSDEGYDNMEVDVTLAAPRTVEIDELADDEDGMEGRDVYLTRQISRSPSVTSLGPKDHDFETLLTPRRSPPDTPAGIDSSLREMSLDSPKPATPQIPSTPATKDSDKCRIYVLDSLGSRHPKVMSQLKTWLEKEAADKKSIDQIQSALAKNVKVPYQPNHFDCGVYLLHFAEIFVQKTEEIQRLNEARSSGPIDAKVRDAVFEKTTLLKKRRTLREKCQQLAREWKEANPTSMDDGKTKQRTEGSSGTPAAGKSDTQTDGIAPTTPILDEHASLPKNTDSDDEIEIVGENPAPISPPKRKRKRDSPVTSSPKPAVLRLRGPPT